MDLYIDTTSNTHIELILKKDKHILVQKKKKAEFQQTEILLSEIDNILTKISKKLSDIESIYVNNNGGSFTSLRIGVVIANALGYALNIPVFGNEVKKVTKKLNIIEPKYNSEPNITISKKQLI